MEGNKENEGNEAANGGEEACTATKKLRILSSILFADPPLTAAAGKQTVEDPTCSGTATMMPTWCEHAALGMEC
eukprot:5382140-Pleurochrysis_carterae.AAC.1